MKKLSTIFLIITTLLLTSCFKKEEKVPVVETPKTEIQNSDISVVTNTWITEKQNDTSTWKTISNSWTIQKQKEEIKKIDAKKVVEKEKNNEIMSIDSYLSNETEEVNEEEKSRMKQNIPEIDTNTLVRFKNSYYFKDTSNIYYYTSDEAIFATKYRTILKWVKIDNFYMKNEKDFRYYWTDWKNIYYEWKKISDKINFKFKILDDDYIYWDNNNLFLFGKTFKWWDITSLNKISDFCYKDKINLYCINAYWTIWFYTIIKWIDLDSVEVVWEWYLKDKYWFYYFDIDWIAKKIDWIDKDTFIKASNNYYNYYFKDKKWVYFQNWEIWKLSLIKLADINSFFVINTNYSKDNKNVYFDWEIIDKADPYSFILINYPYSKDKNSVYWYWSKVEWIQDINNFTFTGWIYQDNKCTYKIEWTEATCTPKENKSSTSLWEIKLIDAYLSDESEKLSVEEIIDLKSYIPEIDNETIVKIKNSRFYKDKNDVYIEHYWIHWLWINPKDFKIIQPDWDYRTDWKNYYLLNDKKIDLNINTLKFAYITNSITSFYIWWDINNLYLWSKIFKWWDINSLEYIPWSDCLKDKTSVYCYLQFLWGTVKKWDIYYKVMWVDTETFTELIPQTYYKDKNSVYYGDIDKILELKWIQDINSFTIINDIPQDDVCIYKIKWTEASCTQK